MPHDDLETMLTTIGRAAVEAARAGKDKEIQQKLDDHARALRRGLFALITANPDPASWTADQHALFMRATNTPTMLHRPTISAKPPTRSKAADRASDNEIPF